MSDVFLYFDITIGLAVVVWGVFQIIQIEKEYKRKLKRIDEWYQSELEWIEEQRKGRMVKHERETNHRGYGENV